MPHPAHPPADLEEAARGLETVAARRRRKADEKAARDRAYQETLARHLHEDYDAHGGSSHKSRATRQVRGV